MLENIYFVSALVGGVTAGLVTLLFWVLSRIPFFKKNFGNFTSKAVGIIAVVAAGAMVREVAPQVRRELAAYTVEKHLLEHPIYREIKAQDPATYNRMLEIFKDVIRRDGTPGEANAFVRPLLSELVSKRISRIPNSALHGLLRLTIIEMKELAEKDPAACMALMYPKQFPPVDLTKLLSKQTQELDLETAYQVIKSSTGQEIPLIREEDFDREFEPIALRLAVRFGKDLAILQHPGSPGLDKKRFCEIAIVMFEEFLAIPDQRGADMFRYLSIKG